MDPLNSVDVVLAGVPRGGTTLACRLLNQVRDTVALSEPMPVHQLPIAPAPALAAVIAFYDHVRQRALGEKIVPSEQRDGRVADNSWGERSPDGGTRAHLVELGEITIDKPLSAHFRLAIKHPAAFTALLPVLSTHFRVVGIVRNPLAVLASWRSLDLPLSRGRAPAAERIDRALATALDAEPDLLRRQVVLLDWYFERLLRWVPDQRRIRYEDIIGSGGRALLRAAGVPEEDALAQPLRSHNTNLQYDFNEVDELLASLREHATSCWQCYSRDEVESLARMMTHHG